MPDLTAEEWLDRACTGQIRQLAKATDATRAWFAEIDGNPCFVKCYPKALIDWQKVERAISAAGPHPNIIPLLNEVAAADGTLLIYPWTEGLNLGEKEGKERFARLPLPARSKSALAVVEALTEIYDLGYVIVDWYEGNMLYDFHADRIWLFDWELCRPGSSFVLDMESNYGSSRLMAPEEFIKGSVIDQRTLIFNLGRYVLLTLPELAEPLAATLSRATYPSKAGRFQTLQAFSGELRTGLTEGL